MKSLFALLLLLSPATLARAAINPVAPPTELAFGIISTESATGLRLGFEPFLEKLSAQEAFGRPAEVWEVANVMMFLASDLSSYMTGEIVSVSSQRA